MKVSLGQVLDAAIIAMKEIHGNDIEYDWEYLAWRQFLDDKEF